LCNGLLHNCTKIFSGVHPNDDPHRNYATDPSGYALGRGLERYLRESDMASQIYKAPYLFDFLGTDAPRREVELERGGGAQLGMYMTAVDRVLVEYALADSAQPISVAEWETQLTRALPQELKGSLPTIEEIEAEWSRDVGDGDEWSAR